jgi:hypothetical protein
MSGNKPLSLISKPDLLAPISLLRIRSAPITITHTLAAIMAIRLQENQPNFSPTII